MHSTFDGGCAVRMQILYGTWYVSEEHCQVGK